MSSRTLAAAVALTVAVGLAACSGDDDGPGGDDPSSSPVAPVETPPGLEATWTQPGLALSSYRAPVVVGDVLVESVDRTVRGLDLTTGETSWTATMPPGLRTCQVAPQGSESGFVGLLLRGGGRRCTVVAALDTRTGELAWTREVPGEPPYHEGRSVATGATTIAATFNCDALHRFRLRDGKPLGVIAPTDRKCAMETATDGRVVLALDDPETAATPDDRGTGWIPPHDAAGAFELWDLDSGRLRWRRPIATTRGASVSAVISSTGPTTVLALEEKSFHTMRVVGPQGRPGPYLGRRLGSEPPTVVGEHDGVVVLRYDASLLFAYDTTTGEELWHLAHAGPADVTDEGVVLATDAYVPTDGTSGWQTWLTRVDLRGGDDVVTLGSAPGQGALFLDGDRVVVGGALYALPDDGEERAYDVPPSPIGPDWGADDLTDDDVLLACDAVGSETLGLLGLDHPDLPRPADCTWRDSADPTYLEQSLRVSVQAFRPGRALSGGARATSPSEEPRELTGPEMAADQVAWQVENGTASYLAPVREVSLPGLGEQVWAASPYDSTTGGSSARVVVRWRNVLVDVIGSQDTRVEDRRYGAVPDDQVQPAVLAAVGEVLEGLGAAPEERVVPATPTTEAVVPSVCRTLRAEAATLAPGTRASDQTPRGDGSTGPSRQSACVWWGPDDDDVPDLDAMVHVVPAGPLGTTAEEEARELLRGGFARAKPVEGLPGVRARFFRYVSDDGTYRSVGIDAIRGDTVVSIDYTDPEGGFDRAEGDRIAVRLVRRLLASVQR
ncbi:PQQ-binding-like beta-propeller repeat protein [Nocardioides sp. C4-1]|uniref:outer membrane protein assembly factor BamB family protein n=1 Tax=Nocardioides sp. C4-1 TaxID=3151851 RepID=UPI003267945A